MCHTNEGCNVVFAVTLYAYVAQQDHVGITGDILKRARKLGCWVLTITAKPFLEGVSDAFGRVGKASAARIITCPGKQRPHSFFCLLA